MTTWEEQHKIPSAKTVLGITERHWGHFIHLCSLYSNPTAKKAFSTKLQHRNCTWNRLILLRNISRQVFYIWIKANAMREKAKWFPFLFCLPSRTRTWPEPWQQTSRRWKARRGGWPGCGTAPELQRPRRDWDQSYWGSDASQTSTRQEIKVCITYIIFCQMGVKWWVSASHRKDGGDGNSSVHENCIWGEKTVFTTSYTYY